MPISYKYYTVGDKTYKVPDFNGMFKQNPLYLLIIPLVLWLATGFYIVGPDEAGVILRFGKLSRVTSSGLHYRIPWPVEAVYLPKVTEVKRISMGYRKDRRGVRDVPEESLMLTGSLNIIDIDLIVQYKIADPVKYLFYVRDVPTTIRLATEAVIRQVVGQHEIDEVLTTGKEVIQVETLTQLQDILDNYHCGVQVTQVQLQDVLPPQEVADAFREVASAKEDSARLINEAHSYRNDIVPKAEGEAAEMILQAEAFAIERVTRAEGDADRFVAMLRAYRKAPTVTRKRMLIETMEEVLPGLTKYILQTNPGSDLINVVAPGIPDPSNRGGSK